MAQKESPFGPGTEKNPQTAWLDATEMFVSETGSDSNSGLSASKPKSSIASAVADAPVHGRQDATLKINVSGSVPVDFSTEEWSVDRVLISGGSLDATGSSGGQTMLCRGTHLVFESVDFVGQEGREYIASDKNGFVDIKSSCTMANEADAPLVQNNSGGGLNIECGLTHDTDVRGNYIISVQNGPCRLSGQITQTGSVNTVSVEIFDGADRVNIAGGIAGLGSDTTDGLISVQGDRHVKISDVPFSGADTVVRDIDGAEVVAQDGLTQLTDINYPVYRHVNGGRWGQSASPESMGLAVNPPSSDDVANKKGMIYYDQAREYWRTYIGDPHFAEDMMGIPTLDSGDTAADMVAGEARIDTSVPELIVVDKDGAAYSVGLTPK